MADGVQFFKIRVRPTKDTQINKTGGVRHGYHHLLGLMDMMMVRRMGANYFLIMEEDEIERERYEDEERNHMQYVPVRE
jgi:ribosomal protein S4E